MNRNVTIVIIVLVLVLIAGYLVWLRSKIASTVTPSVEDQVQVTPTAQPVTTATPSATPKGEEATGSVKTRTATPGAIRR